MPLSTRDSICNNISFSSADGDRVQKNDVSIRLRHNENEEEIPITEMYSPVSELCLHNNRHMNE